MLPLESLGDCRHIFLHITALICVAGTGEVHGFAFSALQANKTRGFCHLSMQQGVN